jgi:spore coat protein U-like protein
MTRQPATLARIAAAALLLTGSTASHAVADCTVSATAVNFGSFAPFDLVPQDSAGNVQVQCSLIGVISVLVNYTITLSTGASGTYAARALAGSTHTLQYNLHVDPARATTWGDGTAGTATVAAGYLLGLLTTTRNYPVYGRVFAGQNVPPGTYGDTITVVVNY